MSAKPSPHILIAGGGVAAVEAVAALRTLAGPLPRITVIAPDDELVPRASSVASPFGLGAPNPLSFAAIQRHAGFELTRGRLAAVRAGEHVAELDGGEMIGYDKLLVAVGACPHPALPRAVTFSGPRDVPALERALDSPRIAFVVPTASSWALPAYELALMAATELRDRGAEPQLTVVMAEPAPLWVFGSEAGRRGACPPPL